MNNFNALKKYTHKTNESEIFIEDVKRISENSFKATCMLLKNHFHYSDFLPTKNLINPIYLLECARQLETFISHTEFNVALNTKFLLTSWYQYYKFTPIENAQFLDIDIQTKHPVNANKRSNEYYFTFHANQKTISKIKINVSYLNEKCYKAIRNNNTHKHQNIKTRSTILPMDVGYNCIANVAITFFNINNLNYTAILNIDNENITYNDHEQDHITGMNITEATKQLCFCYLSKVKNEDISMFIPTIIEAHFFKYIDVDKLIILSIKNIELKDGFYVFFIDVIQCGAIMSSLKLTIERNLWIS
ncbi:TPA: hypothetical protein O5C63_004439 [Salmonella enterica subsp. enterica serovar Mokola]|uniref:A-factor biosynthesis hotdog domain-containing protein n=1 Tax=Salmonella enterica TaxID=28901 RepID=A0A5T2WP18_SALER|nr:hypothetical protein [Salmonella enterica]EAO5525919.1 hypothetical protein [Salmonella enterica subsp. enterica serovar Hvittingfoss]EBX0888271.1 hypothetical protein [Salmonella enterica subsp. enterica serovar Oslo]ECE9636687.1 hypothetical protein [Salmonella enterica subsp. enterica serovar Muenchen]ECJ2445485.1 hypothetical protein [Salmonella enterica subsp. diarizonae]HDA4097345.1 hypothetical protein [Salmonella enterica subsp. enterica serovar Mokola]